MLYSYVMDYRLVRRRRQKNLRMRFDSEGNLVVSSPFFVPKSRIDLFVNSHLVWIEKHRPSGEKKTIIFSKGELENFTRECVAQKCGIMGLEIPNITYYNAKSYWGICYPVKKTVRFSYKCCTLNSAQLEYVVIHELCHLVYSNHGADFWNLVGKYCPQYKQLRASMRS